MIIYIKQAWISLLETPLAGVFMLLGTTLASAMLLVMVQFWHVRVAPYEPVSKRERILYVTGAMAVKVETDSAGKRIEGYGRQMDAVGVPFVKEVFDELPSAEAVAVASGSTTPVFVDIPGDGKGENFDLRLVNSDFWLVFNPLFVNGKPFSEEVFRSGQREAIVTSEVARQMFGSIDVVGRTLRLDYVEYRIRGVIEPVNRVVSEVYGQIFIPYTCDAVLMSTLDAEGICGALHVYLLASSPSSFPVIREEISLRTARFNANAREWEARLFEQPLTSNQRMFQEWHQTEPGAMLNGMIGLATLFFFLPVFNLLGITSGLLRRRLPEIGLRKAFGATTATVVRQMLCENLIITVAGCLLGQVFALLFFWVAKDGLLQQPMEGMRLDMFFSPLFLGLSLCICLVINALSTGIPTWRIARGPVIEALGERDGK